MKIFLSVAITAVVLFGAAAAALSYISPPEDDSAIYGCPPEFFCADAGNVIDRQTDGNCAAYAAAYLMRHFGEDADGEALVPELRRFFGFVPASGVEEIFNRRGYQAKACHGSIDTLKWRLTSGNPVIVFVRIPGDTHYAVVVGYDDRFIYLADSLTENAEGADAGYNRVLSVSGFEEIWQTGPLLPDNIYITVKQKEQTSVRGGS